MSGTPYYMDFPDIDSVVAYLDRPWVGPGRSSTKDGAADSWDLGVGYQGAYDAYTGGWSEGAQKAYELAEKLRPEPRAKRRTMQRAVVGGTLNTGAMLAGSPKSMFRVSYRDTHAKPYVHLYVPIGFAGSVDANTAFDRGCALVAIIDALEDAGCRCKVTLTRNSDIPNGKYICMRFMVKDYGDSLDIDQLIFTAAHPAMFRRIGFALQERCDDKDALAYTKGVYGMPSELRDADCEEEGNITVVRFPRLTPGISGTPEDFLRRMVAVLPDEIQTRIGE